MPHTPKGDLPEKVKSATSVVYQRALYAACTEGRIGRGRDQDGNVMLWLKTPRGHEKYGGTIPTKTPTKTRKHFVVREPVYSHENPPRNSL